MNKSEQHWLQCAAELPPLGVPVWLWDPRAERLWIGCREEIDGDGTWLYGNSYGHIWRAGGEWKGDNEADEDYQPTHWMRLPIPPNDQHQATASTKP